MRCDVMIDEFIIMFSFVWAWTAVLALPLATAVIYEIPGIPLFQFLTHSFDSIYPLHIHLSLVVRYL